MIQTRTRLGKPGFVSYVLVISTGMILTLLMILTYRRAISGQKVQSSIQLKMDYAEKEDAILRSIVALTPNRAIRAMQHNSNGSSASRDPLSWEEIFKESLDFANARTSIPSNVVSSMNITDLVSGNSGDSSLGTMDRMFDAMNNEDGYASMGVNRSLGTGFPVPLTTVNATTISRDGTYPIISSDKKYGTLAQAGVSLPVGEYPDFNVLTYPQINFGYARPGDPFVAKRNWWAFAMDVADHDDHKTLIAHSKRNFVLSIYEIPSQLAISASSFMSLGKHSSGEAWGEDVSIDGGIFAGKALVEGDAAFSALSSRRGMTLSSNSSIGGRTFDSNPFTPGIREQYQITEGEFFPVSLASESGRVAFVPINRGAEFFDRFVHSTESQTLSPTSWNNYSIGALQCAMRLDITEVESSTNATPTELRFSYMQGGTRQDLVISLTDGLDSGLPPGYLYACAEYQTYDFGDAVVDLAYGRNGVYAFQNDATGEVTFNNARFGDPLVGVNKRGYYRPSYPFEVKKLPSEKICLAVYPERFKAFLESLNADDTSVNNSLVVNVDYTTMTGSVNLTKPSVPCTDLDYGLIIQECSDLTSFSTGFSVVTNLRTFIGDDFNTVEATPPSGYIPSGKFYPPCSMFTPEKRYGVEVDPFAVVVGGQIGSLASDTDANPVQPLESKTLSGASLAADRIKVNLRPITHPAELPPISMMNWLVVLEELRAEFQ